MGESDKTVTGDEILAHAKEVFSDWHPPLDDGSLERHLYLRAIEALEEEPGHMEWKMAVRRLGCVLIETTTWNVTRKVKAEVLVNLKRAAGV